MVTILEQPGEQVTQSFQVSAVAEKVIEVRAIEKSFGASQVVKEVSLDVRSGEIFGLLGPNGAGKTTLISVLTGILSPDKGSATICGYDLVREIRKIKDVVSLVPQDLTIYQELSALENLTFFGHMYHLSSSQLQKRVNEVLEIVQLKDVAKKKVATYSGGMKRRLNLAIGLLNQPRVLFLDEPTVGIDPQSRNHIFECIRMLVSERNMSVFYTTHYMEEAQALCQQVAIYDHGQIIAQGSPQELIHRIGNGRLTFLLNELPTTLLASIQALPSVQNAEYAEPTLTISAISLYQAAADSIALLQDAGVEVKDMQTQETNLETVFLSLTGKDLRE